MAVIHQTVLTPSKLELLTSWLPSRTWYAGSGEPALTKAGGFRLDDPQGEVGIEFIIVNDASATYLVPLTYRGAPLAEAERALVGTMEHGVLGRRWAYDGCHDPVLVAQLFALIEGRAEPQDQNASDTPDPKVTRSYTGDGPIPALATVTDDQEGTELSALDGTTLRLHRILRPADTPHPSPVGHVAGTWQMPDGTRAQGLFAELHTR